VRVARIAQRGGASGRAGVTRLATAAASSAGVNRLGDVHLEAGPQRAHPILRAGVSRGAMAGVAPPLSAGARAPSGGARSRLARHADVGHEHLRALPREGVHGLAGRGGGGHPSAVAPEADRQRFAGILLVVYDRTFTSRSDGAGCAISLERSRARSARSARCRPRHLVELRGEPSRRATAGPRLAVATLIVPACSSIQAPRPTARRTEPSVPANAREKWAQPAPALRDVNVLVVDDERIPAKRWDRPRAPRASGGTASSPASQDALAREPLRCSWPTSALPGEDGYALLRKVRALPAESGGADAGHRLTGYASPQDRVGRAAGAGFQMHVSKPVTPASWPRGGQARDTRPA